MSSHIFRSLAFKLRADVIRRRLNKTKPTRSELVRQIFKYDQDSIYEDDQGRIYIMSTKTPLYYRLIETGLIDDKFSFLFWIFLPDKLNNTHIYKSRKSRRDRTPQFDELMLFPQVDDTIKLRRWNNKSLSFYFTITSYYEQLNRKIKITPVTLTSNTSQSIGRKAQIDDTFFTDISKDLNYKEESSNDDE